MSQECEQQKSRKNSVDVLKSRVLVLHTGGTIGSKWTDHGRSSCRVALGILDMVYARVVLLYS